MSLKMLMVLMCSCVASLQAMSELEPIQEPSVDIDQLNIQSMHEPNSMLPEDAKLLISLLNFKAEILIQNADFLHKCYHTYCFNNTHAQCAHCSEREMFKQILCLAKEDYSLARLVVLAKAAAQNVRCMLQQMHQGGKSEKIKDVEKKAFMQAIKSMNNIRSRY
jgi:hypothetical protein